MEERVSLYPGYLGKSEKKGQVRRLHQSMELMKLAQGEGSARKCAGPFPE
jgi:hypothetical protein